MGGQVGEGGEGESGGLMLPCRGLYLMLTLRWMVRTKSRRAGMEGQEVCRPGRPVIGTFSGRSVTSPFAPPELRTTLQRCWGGDSCM